MTLTSEQVQELKNQLRQQVDSQNLPPDQKAQALKQIDEMSPGAIETMLKQQGQQSDQTPVYRKIIDSEIPSINVGENQDAVAVLDNKPISKGHIVIIPKTQVKTPKQIPPSVFKLAETLSAKIIENLKAKETKAHTETKFGEAILNVIPIYTKQLDINSPRVDATPEELQKIKQTLETIKVKPKAPKKVKKTKQRGRRPKLKRRIP
tara:strand:+ start:928 stop:1548 length:621 start_codon:yes stop_codon:yes gene_type:complete